jgi:hypothetical protein
MDNGNRTRQQVLLHDAQDFLNRFRKTNFRDEKHLRCMTQFARTLFERAGVDLKKSTFTAMRLDVAYEQALHKLNPTFPIAALG